MEQAVNMEKYSNYKEQMGRLKRAMAQGFYLEAIFIEYAILEDRLESILRHSGQYNPKPDEYWSIDRKLRKVEKLAEQKKGLSHKYFSAELLASIREWKEQRNQLIHALMKKPHYRSELQQHAEKGSTVVKLVCNKTKSYCRALEKETKKGAEA